MPLLGVRLNHCPTEAWHTGYIVVATEHPRRMKLHVHEVVGFVVNPGTSEEGPQDEACVEN